MATESFFSNASLAYLASAGAGKDGKTYSIKPTDGSGDFTFSRGSNLAATRVGPTGLIEKGRENLLLQSNQFDTTWTDGGTATLTSGQSGYDGSNDAWLLEALSTSFIFYQGVSSSGVCTISIYAKAGTTDKMAFYVVTSPSTRAGFDLTSGSVDFTLRDVDASIEDVGNGWYRCSMTFEGASTSVRIYPTDSSLSPAIGDNIYIQDAQLEIGLSATDYIESGATTGKAGLLEDEPRFDYSGGATCPSLLLEPSRTQYLPYSEYLSGLGGDAGLDFNYNDATSPEGLTNAVQVVSNNTGQSYFGYFNGTAPVGDNTFSVFAKYDNCQHICIRILGFTTGDDGYYWFDIQNGTKGSKSGSTITYDIEDYGNGWYRCYVIHNVDAGDLSGAGRIYLCDSDNNLNSALNKAAHLYGNQWEAGSYPTSYIPNHSGGSVTRGDDVLDGAGDTNTFNDSEGVLFLDVENVNANSAISISDDSTSDFIQIYLDHTDSNPIRYRASSGGTSQFDKNFPYSLDVSQPFKVAYRYSANNFSIWINGVKADEVLSGSTPVGLSTIEFYNIFGAGSKFDGKLNQALYFPEALSDADCIALTTL
jgi:hypothetical protein